MNHETCIEHFLPPLQLCKLRRECFASMTYAHVSIWSVSYTGMVARRVVYVINSFVSLQRFVAVAFPLQVMRNWTCRPTIFVSRFQLFQRSGQAVIHPECASYAYCHCL